MRRLSPLVCLALLAGCPSSGFVPGDAGVSSGDGGPDGPDAAVCAPIANCEATFRYEGGGTNVILRGDFAADGWTVGVPMQQVDGGWEASVPARDEVSITYKFVVDGSWITDPANTNTSPDGFGGNNSVRFVDCDGCGAPTAVFDWRDSVMYFAMIDRFYDGDQVNNAPVGGIETAADYQGGDLAGLRQKVESGYFNDLGINTLWITSPFDNANAAGLGSDGYSYSGYHGYWPRDLDAVESKIGTAVELQSLVKAAHDRGIKVILDYVMNHVHAENPIYSAHPEWFWPNDNGFGGNCVCGDGCSWDDEYQRKRCWFTSYLPDFDFNNAFARNYSVSNAMKWAKELGVDGFRLDAVKHLETSWLTDLRSRLVAEVPGDETFYLVGETFTGQRDLIKAYVDPATMLDGQFDFPLRSVLARVLLKREGNMGELESFVQSNDTFYGAGSIMSTFIGNHDVPRAIHMAEDSPQFGEWDDGKGRAWNNRPQLPTAASAFERIALAYGFLMTSPGIPLVYYGDEIGMPGAGDPDNRRFMQWDGLSTNQLWLRERLAKLAEIRAAELPLRRGTRTSLGATNDTFTYEMKAGAERIIIVLHRGDVGVTVPAVPAGSYVELISGQTLSGPISIGARSALVLKPTN